MCLWHKTIYKVTNLKVHSKGRYLVFKKSLFKNYSERLVWTTKLFSCICDITNCKSRLWKFEWLAGGEKAWLSTTRFKIETQCGCFYITSISYGNQLFSEHFGCHFHFILHIMSDKAGFVRGALFVQPYRGNLELEVCAGLFFKSRSRKVLFRNHPIPLYIHSLFTCCPL